MAEPTRWTLKGFCNHFRFVHEKMPDHAFAWVLGAGASRDSGIPTGGELTTRWLSELHERLADPAQPLATWATAENLDIKGFDYTKSASFYPRIYERRYRDHPEEGFACLEELMAGKDPSPGYSILAKVMEKQRHRVVITTNFDNLVADALAIYTDTYPFVCGHEALTSFVRTAMRRPLVCKIHRDLLLGPKNDTRSMKRLHDAWASALKPLLSQYTPIFIGYGGNDDSLMDLLESLETTEIKGQLIWCYYEKDEPSERIKELVIQHRGVLVPVPGFDLFMILLASELGIELPDANIEERARQRAENYRKRILALDTTNHPTVTTALTSTIERAGGPLAVVLKARAEKDTDKREKILQQGIQQFPKSAIPFIESSHFYVGTKYDPSKAEELCRKALELEPQETYVAVQLACILEAQRNFEKAEKTYLAAEENDPKSAHLLVNHASMLEFLGRTGEASIKFERALAIEPNNTYYHIAYASFNTAMGKFEKSAKHIKIAKKLDDSNNKSRRRILLTECISFLTQSRIQDAANTAEQALKTEEEEETTQTKAKLFFCAALIERCRAQDDTHLLSRLKYLLRTDFNRFGWYFEGILQATKLHLADEDSKFYSELAAAIDTSKAVPLLENSARWKSLTPTM